MNKEMVLALRKEIFACKRSSYETCKLMIENEKRVAALEIEIEKFQRENQRLQNQEKAPSLPQAGNDVEPIPEMPTRSYREIFKIPEDIVSPLKSPVRNANRNVKETGDNVPSALPCQASHEPLASSPKSSKYIPFFAFRRPDNKRKVVFKRIGSFGKDEKIFVSPINYLQDPVEDEKDDDDDGLSPAKRKRFFSTSDESNDDFRPSKKKKKKNFVAKVKKVNLAPKAKPKNSEAEKASKSQDQKRSVVVVSEHHDIEISTHRKEKFSADAATTTTKSNLKPDKQNIMALAQQGTISKSTPPATKMGLKPKGQVSKVLNAKISKFAALSDYIPLGGVHSSLPQLTERIATSISDSKTIQEKRKSGPFASATADSPNCNENQDSDLTSSSTPQSVPHVTSTQIESANPPETKSSFVTQRLAMLKNAGRPINRSEGKKIISNLNVSQVKVKPLLQSFVSGGVILPQKPQPRFMVSTRPKLLSQKPTVEATSSKTEEQSELSSTPPEEKASPASTDAPKGSRKCSTISQTTYLLSESSDEEGNDFPKKENKSRKTSSEPTTSTTNQTVEKLPDFSKPPPKFDLFSDVVKSPEVGKRPPPKTIQNVPTLAVRDTTVPPPTTVQNVPTMAVPDTTLPPPRKIENVPTLSVPEVTVPDTTMPPPRKIQGVPETTLPPPRKIENVLRPSLPPPATAKEAARPLYTMAPNSTFLEEMLNSFEKKKSDLERQLGESKQELEIDDYQMEIAVNLCNSQLGRLWKAVQDEEMKNIIKNLANFPADKKMVRRHIIAQCIYMAVRDEGASDNSSLGKRSAPTLSYKQKKILYTIHLLEGDPKFDGFTDQFLDLIRHCLFDYQRVPKFKLNHLVNLSRMYLAICKMKGNEKFARQFIYEVFFFKHTRSHILVFVFLQTWPEILRSDGKVDPLVETLVWLIFNTGKGKQSEDMKIFESRRLLQEKCLLDRHNAEGSELVNYLIMEATKNVYGLGITETITNSLVLIAKWRECDWVVRHIISPLLNVMRDNWLGDNSAEGHYKHQLLGWVIDTIGYLCRLSAYRNRQTLVDLMSPITVMLENKTGSQNLESICLKCVVRIGHYLPAQVAKFFVDWHPKYELDPDVKDLVLNYIGTKGLSFAQNLTKALQRNKIHAGFNNRKYRRAVQEEKKSLRAAQNQSTNSQTK